jgi:transposase
MDAGFASEKNVKLLQESGYFYIVVSRKAKPIISDDIASVVVKDSITNKVTATLMDGANDKKPRRI